MDSAWTGAPVLVLWFGLVVLVGKDLMLQMRIYNKRCIMGHLWFEAKWSSGHLVIFSVWSGLVGSGLALVWCCGKTNQSLPVFLMQDAQGHGEPLPQATLILGQMTLEYQKQLNAYREREEKAAGDILAHLSRSQQTHVKDKGSDAKGI
jgi:hypothetical protein